MSNQDQYTVEELDRENKALKARFDLIQEAYFDVQVKEEVLSVEQDDESQTALSKARFMLGRAIAKAPSQSLADIKADAIDELIKDKSYSTQVNGIATSIIDADGAIQYADGLRSQS